MPSNDSPAFFGLTPATKQFRPLPYSRHIVVWNCPVLPVTPCVITRVCLFTRIDMSLSLGGVDDLARRVGHVAGGDDRQSRLDQGLLAEVFVGALHAHDKRHREFDLRGRLD